MMTELFEALMDWKKEHDERTVYYGICEEVQDSFNAFWTPEELTSMGLNYA